MINFTEKKGFSLKFEFLSQKLEDLYTKLRGQNKYPPEIVDAFFEKMDVIRNAKDERDLYALKSLHYEKLQGTRKDEKSIRLNKQWRLTLKVIERKNENHLQIIKIENHYK